MPTPKMNNNKYSILIGSDHGGFELKQKIVKILKNKKYIINIEDVGCYDNNSCDYPIIAKKLCNSLLKKKSSKKNSKLIGILICGTGIGISITANKIKNIRCALISNQYTAKMAREHNHANCIAFGGRIQYLEKIEEILESFFLAKESTEKRHLNRILTIEN